MEKDKLQIETEKKLPEEVDKSAAIAENPPPKNQPEESKESEKEPKEKAKRGKNFLLFGISLNEKVFLAKHLSTILKAGMDLPESLRIVQRQLHGGLKNVLGDVSAKVEGGKSLNVALSEYPNVFDPLFINMVKVGEKSGTLDQSLHYLSIQLSKDAKLISKVKSAALYPLIVLSAAVVVGGGVSYFVLPKLTKLFTSFKADLPLATKILLAISNNLQHYGFWWLAGIILVIILFSVLLRVRFFRAIWNNVTLHTPVAGKIIISLNLARFSLTLGTLLKSGVAIDDALGITKEAITSIPYQKTIKRVLDSVSTGKTITESLDQADRRKRLFPPTVRAMIDVGERTGSLYNSLLYISEFYEEEVDNMTKDMATTLEPILLLIISFVVAFVAIAIISPMYQVLNVIK